MQFLDVFNETDLKAEVVEFKNYKTFDFNTVEEFHALMESRILR
jgi:ASC-1-like (ASCH) protein